MITIDPPSSFHTERRAISRPALTRFLDRACQVIGLSGTISVLLTSDVEMKRLNRTFRGKNRPTDVLSFPADRIPGLAESEQHAGDLAISLDTAGRQAAQFGHTLAAEVRVLLLHGLLHLAGHDHETDGGEMAAEEQRLRKELRLPLSLIARVDAEARVREGRVHPSRSVQALLPGSRRARA